MRFSGGGAILLFSALAHASAPAGPWDAFHYAPESKTVLPAAVYSTQGTVVDADKLVLGAGSATLQGKGSFVALDFGREVGGLISINFESPDPASSVSLAFTESSTLIRADASDDSAQCTDSTKYDGVEQVLAPIPAGVWTQPKPSMRGGFRYLTIVLASDTPMTISGVSCAISFMPHFDNLRDYAGYFYAKDPVYAADEDILTKVWYAGAYTVQTNTVPIDTGRHWPPPASPGWATDAGLGDAGPAVIVDGAKRDRSIWPGDMGVAVPTVFVSTNDLLSVHNSLVTLFGLINTDTGELPFAGPPLFAHGSDTYHAWTLVGVRNYYIYSGDWQFLSDIWTNYVKAVGFLEAKVNNDAGLLEITKGDDWGRSAGGINAEGNALFYKVLTDAADLANEHGNTDLRDGWLAKAAAIKARYNEVFWDDATGMYRDAPDSTLYAQDTNSEAILFQLVDSPDKSARISEALTTRWNDFGAVAPELPDTICPFVGSLELQAHFESGNDERALDLIRLEWGYMLYTNISTQSTFLEGYTTTGGLGYRANSGYANDVAYTSHAHGWSTGPTSALTFYVTGVTIVEARGRKWRFAPHTSGLSAAQGSFETPLGTFGATWTLDATGFDANVTVPDTAIGQVSLAFVKGMTGQETVLVDGNAVGTVSQGLIDVGAGGHRVQIQLIAPSPPATCTPKKTKRARALSLIGL